jgi:pimeloyl-ACP methyl ester carboxylesterase
VIVQGRLAPPLTSETAWNAWVMLIATVFAALAAICLILLCAAGYLGRLVVREPGSHRLVSYRLGANGESVFFTDEPATVFPGEYGLWFGGGKEGGPHARIGAIVSVSDHGRTVEREVIEVTGGTLSRHGKGLWTGHVFPHPESLHIPYSQIYLDAAGQRLPCWIFGAESAPQPGPWVVHVHGIRTTRLTTLRNVQLASRLGLTSLVPSFRSDEENAGPRGASSTLGLLEWQDVDRAVSYAKAQGAQSVILFGLSLGGLISLLLCKYSTNRAIIQGAILVAPVTNFRATIRYAATQLRLPGAVGGLAVFALSSRLLHRFTGASGPIDFSLLRLNTQGEEMSVPTLIIHSPIDDEVPYEESAKLATNNPGTVSLDSSLRAFHTVEWNLDPDRYEAIVTEWLDRNGFISTASGIR